ncbi:ferrochelatase [Alkalihalophilus pseudofirmus]|uniref:Coproporphyrin III ferrochelatase n=1 Tax=Alkalihalophilus pseudofirmus TaxID=79885 RepID=A0AAJ2NR14_ALKPS|nr:ferrochelatase [Alkalihalophilus pseudofirmus]MDV2886916.1 ferrochelatase [Alkalihalophilus pseudofirmus]WEG17653.1 ferrochelatase [Alkalihalophilus pseudofirmus]
MSKKKYGLLVMAYGTPRSKEEIEPYYTHIRRGRKPSEEALTDLTERYEAIGGISPLAKITEDQAYGLERYLNEQYEDYEFKAYLGLKHIDPFVEDAVQQMKEDGIEEAVSIVLAPHFSTFSVKSYNGRAKEEAEKIGGPVIHSIESWYDEPKFIQYWADQVKQTMEKIEDKEKACVIFSAHSLPERIIAMGDPYPEQLQETADLIAKEAGIKNYTIGWQSEGNTPDPWIGPDVQDLTRDLYNEHGYTSMVYCPVGFVADHLEVLYDNDVECKVVTDELGIDYFRPEMPNAKDEFLDCLATVVSNKLKEKE